jgi:hypothetical protein
LNEQGKDLVMNMHQVFAGTRRMLVGVPIVLAVLTAADAAVAQVASAGLTRSAVTVTVSGTVGGQTGVSGSAMAAQEPVAFHRVLVEIGSTLAKDSDPALPPVLIVDITFLKAHGVGLVTKGKFIAEANVTKQRLFAANDVIAITFPFNLDRSPVHESRSGHATFHLTFDTNGVITGASGSIDSNTF